VPVPFPNQISNYPGIQYSMNNFNDNEEYKIEIVIDAPYMANNVQMTVGGVAWTSGSVFTYHSGNNFAVSYFVSNGANTGQTQLLKFQIFRKRLFGVWDWQTSFFHYLSTVCITSDNLVQGQYPLFQGDYEVSGDLTVASSVLPSSGLVEFDGGSSVTLLPGFITDLSQGGSVLAIIDGCGGAFRISNPIINNPKSSETVEFNRKNSSISVYPNPIQSQLTIDIPDAIVGTEYKIEIKDMKGTLFYSENKIYNHKMLVDVNKLESGLYFLTIYGENLNHFQKIFVEE
jgi:hypothetical protein